MDTVILACETIKNELKFAMEETKVDYPVYYIESGLHNAPHCLGQRIQEAINKINASTILLAFGYCGNSMLGIKSSQAKLVLPKIDDCISLLVGSYDKRNELSQEMGTYFFTQGWLHYETNLLTEYERCVNKYGEVRALKIMKTMLGNYKRFTIIDTGAYPIDDIVERIACFAAKLNIAYDIYHGSMRLFHKLLLGHWDDEFIILSPCEEFSLNNFLIINENVSQL